jgi:putative molybdopterin biosynthesis protein
MERKIYLDNLSVEEAKDRWYSNLKLEAKVEEIDIREALGRRTAHKVVSRFSAPHYHASAMDGIAVKVEDVAGASESNPIRLDKADYQLVDTGDPIPAGFNAVIMIEDVNFDQGLAQVEKGVTPWQHIRTIGESLVKGELILPVEHQITPYDIGLVLEGGVTKVDVYSQPEIEIIPTGTELVEPGSNLERGDIIEYNSHVLGNSVSQWGAIPIRHDIIADDYQRIKRAVFQASQRRDIVIVTAGSSAGREDYTSQIIEELGEVLVHGVSIKPGGPVILGKIGDTPVIGLPGYPVAAALTCRLFVGPLISQLLGKQEFEVKKVTAQLSSKVVSSLGFREFLRVKLSQLDNKLIATPLSRSSGVMGSLVEGDGIMAISEFSEGLESGAEVEVELLQDNLQAENSLLAIGSHDLTLELLKDELNQAGVDLLSKHVGSMGGLTALKRRETHIAGMHLLDAETGDYNQEYVDKFLPNRDIILVNLVYREQGLMVAKDNPKEITGLEDLVRDEILFINRQRGAGTRVLLDYKLQQLGISKGEIEGYGRIEYTHLTLAAAIASGSADLGLGILAAAQAFDLDFIPVAKERYDLAIPKEYWNDSRTQKLLDIIRSDKFKAEVNQLSGYDTSQTGQVMNNVKVD